MRCRRHRTCLIRVLNLIPVYHRWLGDRCDGRYLVHGVGGGVGVSFVEDSRSLRPLDNCAFSM